MDWLADIGHTVYCSAAARLLAEVIGSVEGILEVLGGIDRSRAVVHYITLRKGIDNENRVAVGRSAYSPVECIHGVVSTAPWHDDDGRKWPCAIRLEHHIHVGN